MNNSYQVMQLGCAYMLYRGTGGRLLAPPHPIQGLRSEFQMTGASHYLMTQIHSKTVQFSILHDNLLKIDGCNWGFLKIDGYNCTRCTRSNGASVHYIVSVLMFKAL